MTRSIVRTLSGNRWSALTAAAILGALLLAGCASGGAAAGAPADVPPAAPAAPAKKPFEPPAWEASVYQNEELGFSVHYPTDFAEQPPQDGSLFTAASPMQVPRLDVSRSPAGPDVALEDVLPALAESLGQLGGGEATVKESRETKLRDEVTPAIEAVIDWSFQGFPLQSFVLGTIQGDSVITVMVTGMQGGEVAELSDIAYTLYFD
ncbi:MAG TPA: hypothetical protein VMT85_12005 [Thermoanaerobaculia bacterium]|nr:hypothetical protein [Thermoanaerobaculia bacterium]